MTRGLAHLLGAAQAPPAHSPADRNVSRVVLHRGEGLLPAGEILLRSRAGLFLLPLLGGASHQFLGTRITPPQPLCVGVSSTATLHSGQGEG